MKIFIVVMFSLMISACSTSRMRSYSLDKGLTVHIDSSLTSRDVASIVHSINLKSSIIENREPQFKQCFNFNQEKKCFTSKELYVKIDNSQNLDAKVTYADKHSGITITVKDEKLIRNLAMHHELLSLVK